MSLSSLLIAVPLVGAQPSPGDHSSPAVIASIAEDRTAAPPTLPQPAEIARPAAPETAGDITVTARPAPPPGDPLQDINVQSFELVQAIDKGLTAPVARGYKKAVPSPVRRGLRNALRNLGEPVVILNYILQLKPEQSLRTLGRFTINSTIGVAGLFDAASKRPFNLPHCSNGFAYTLGYYGVKSGPYMYLPLIGPTTVRDLAGRLGDLSLLPVVVGKPFNDPAFAIPTTVIRLIDERAEADDETMGRSGETGAAYSTVRDRYLQKRQSEIDALHQQKRIAPSTGAVVMPQNCEGAPAAPPIT